MELIANQTDLTMSSREIAELCGKRHDHVMRDIEKALTELNLGAPKFGGTYKSKQGKELKEYRLPKDLTLTIVTGYKVEWRKKIIDRWLELEAQASDPMKALSDPLQLRNLLGNYAERVIELEGENEVLGQKAAVADRISTANGLYSIRESAKIIGVRERYLIKWLHANNWVFRSSPGAPMQGYSEKVKTGYLEHKTHLFQTEYGEDRTVFQTKVTNKGIARLTYMLGLTEEAAA